MMVTCYCNLFSNLGSFKYFIVSQAARDCVYFPPNLKSWIHSCKQNKNKGFKIKNTFFCSSGGPIKVLWGYSTRLISLSWNTFIHIVISLNTSANKTTMKVWLRKSYKRLTSFHLYKIFTLYTELLPIKNI